MKNSIKSYAQVVEEFQARPMLDHQRFGTDDFMAWFGIPYPDAQAALRLMEQSRLVIASRTRPKLYKKAGAPKDKFTMPADIQARGLRDTISGIRIRVTPEELLAWMKRADKALNGDSNDAEHEALHDLREWLSGVYEDPERRNKP